MYKALLVTRLPSYYKGFKTDPNWANQIVEPVTLKISVKPNQTNEVT